VKAEIRLYIEGGGDSAEAKAQLRRGFRAFLSPAYQKAREARVAMQVILCGSRTSTREDFLKAFQSHPTAFNVILVDSEERVSSAVRKHLADRDGWTFAGVDESQLQLMVQAMETWFVADPDALLRFYGNDFRLNAIPKAVDVEEIDKDQLLAALREATRQTQKGKYQKIRHASLLLALIDPEKVQQAAEHCRRLFAVVEQRISRVA